LDLESKSKLRWSETAGLVAVIVSLLLLAWEIRENTQIATAQANLELNAMANEVLISEGQNPQLAALLVRAEDDRDSLSRAEYRQFQTHVYTMINALDAAHGFFVQGVLDEEDFSGWREYSCHYIAGKSVNEVWESFKPTFGEEFVTFVADSCGL